MTTTLSKPLLISYPDNPDTLTVFRPAAEFTFTIQREEDTFSPCDCQSCVGDDGDPEEEHTPPAHIGWTVRIVEADDPGGYGVSYGRVFAPTRTGMPYIYGVRTHDPWQGMGLCKQVMHELEMIVRREYPDATCITLDATTAGKRVYEKVGYRVEPDVRAYLYSGIAAMRKELR